jgi:hypothetical protein
MLPPVPFRLNTLPLFACRHHTLCSSTEFTLFRQGSPPPEYDSTHSITITITGQSLFIT